MEGEVMTGVREITPQEIREAAKRVYDQVDEKFSYRDVVEGWEPNTPNGACKYVVGVVGIDAKAACIVGRILAEAGVPIEVLAEPSNGSAMAMLRHLNQRGWFGYDPLTGGWVSNEHDAIDDALFNAQGSQDNGAPWRRALRESGLVVTE